MKWARTTKKISQYRKRKLIAEINKAGISEQLSTYITTAMLAIFDEDDEFFTVLCKLLKSRNGFYGYDAEGSTAPPASIITEGRANPARIRYLYAAEEIDTAIYEVRPIIGQLVSVAAMSVISDLKVFDFTKSIEDQSGLKLNRQSLVNTIGSAFAKPNHDKKEKYMPTQFVAEFVKNLGFDGIKYKSSLHEGGMNILIFYPDKSKPIHSDLHFVDAINISSSKFDVCEGIDR